MHVRNEGAVKQGAGPGKKDRLWGTQALHHASLSSAKQVNGDLDGDQGRGFLGEGNKDEMLSDEETRPRVTGVQKAAEEEAKAGH